MSTAAFIAVYLLGVLLSAGAFYALVVCLLKDRAPEGHEFVEVFFATLWPFSCSVVVVFLVAVIGIKAVRWLRGRIGRSERE